MRGARWVAPAALAVALLSLGLNVYLIMGLRQPERVAGPLAVRVLERLAAEDVRIPYTVRIPSGTPIRFDIPVDERLIVKVNTQLPIDTRVRVPVRSPMGNYSLSLPIRANLPIRTEIPVRVKHVFELRTQTETQYEVPLEIRVRDLPLDALRRGLSP